MNEEMAVEDVIQSEVEQSERTRDAPLGASAARKNRGAVLSVRLNDDELAAIEFAAEDAGLPVSTLVRSWIVERLRSSGSGGAQLPAVRELIRTEVAAAVNSALEARAI